jgi:dTDP-4-dehydrorhamnose 3,5-epimerase
MDVVSLAISDVKIVTPRRFADSRGFFSETYNARTFKAAGIEVDFVQDNHSYSAKKGTVRGLHYQVPPHAQAKLVRVLKGAIVDVAVDARKASPTYGKWVKAELSAENSRQIFVPAGFLHGFATLEPDTEVAYKVDAFYHGPSEGAVIWNDPTLAIDWGIEDWGVEAGGALLSDKDAKAQSWAEFTSPF